MTEWAKEAVNLISFLCDDLHKEALLLACRGRRLCRWGRWRRPFLSNGRDLSAKFLFAIRRNVDEHSQSIAILKTFCRGAAEATSKRDYFIRDVIHFGSGSSDCDFGHAQNIWRRRKRRCVLDGFCNLLPHLGLKQRAVRILAFVSEDEPETDTDVYKHENHECNPYPDCHFVA